MSLDPHDPWSYVRGLQPVSLCDWPEKISCVLFLGGCNLCCPTCHNFKLAWKPETLPQLSKDHVFSFIQERKEWLDGIVITGGEPTCNPKLSLLLKQLQEFDLPIKLDTNGLYPEKVIKLFNSGLIQLVAVDIKGPWHKYPCLTGNKCSGEYAQNSLIKIFSLAKASPSNFYFRCTLVPKLSNRDIEEIKTYLPNKFELKIQRYISPPKDKVS